MRITFASYLDTMTQSGPSLRNWLILILLTVVWGTSFILIKKGLVSFSGIQVGALRITIAFLVFVPYVFRVLRRIPRDRLLYVLAIGAFGSFIPSFLIPLGQMHVDSSTTGILASLTPLTTYIWGITLFNKHASKRRSLGVLIGLTGAVSLMIDPSSSLGFNSYVLLIMFASVFYGISSNIVHSQLTGVKSGDITTVSFAMIGIPAIAILMMTDFTQVMQTDPNAWTSLGAVAILSIVGTALALMLFWKLVQETDPVFSSMTTYLIPVVAIIWGLVDGESIYSHQYFGFGLIILSVFLVRKNT